MSQHIGIVACSAEGAAICYRTICVEGAELLGRHGHPEVSMHTYSLAQLCLRTELAPDAGRALFEKLQRERPKDPAVMLLGARIAGAPEEGARLRAKALELVLGLGVRLVTLSHIASHEWCDAAGDEELHGGLSAAGEQIVRRLNREGVIVDVSHVSDRAVEHVISVSAAPIVASHSSARALCAHPRNLTDALARAVVERGGLVMAMAFPAFLDDAAAAANRARMQLLREPMDALAEAYAERPVEMAEARRALLAGHPQPAVPLATYADHVMHLVEVVGEEGVGIGTDFDGIPEVPVGFEDASCFPSFVGELRRRGLDEPALRLVLGDNFRRVWREVDRRAGGRRGAEST